MGKAQHATPREEKEPWPCGREKVGKQESLPWQEQRAGGKTNVTRSLCGERNLGC